MAASSRRPGRPRGADFTSPLTIPGGEVAGVEIVRELAPDVALPAWQTLRSVLMWAAEEPGQRSDLFEPCAMAEWERDLLEGEWDADLRLPLAVAVGELSRGTHAASDTLAHACLCVADWALERNAVATAMGFAEAAALCWPQSPRYAWMAARLLRRYGHNVEAERWLRRAIKVATATEDFDIRVLALDSLGNLLHTLGKNTQAMNALKDGLRLARRHRLRDRTGEILHDLFVVSTWMGNLDAAEEYARDAFEIYREGHRRLPALAHDVASLWISRGYFLKALPVLRGLPPFFDLMDERIKVHGAIARAAAACGEPELFDEARDAVWALAEDPYTRTHAAAPLLEVARGAGTLRRWEEAQKAASAAMEIAGAVGESDIAVNAEVLLKNIREGRADDEAQIAADRRPAPHVETLAAGFLASLSMARRAANFAR